VAFFVNNNSDARRRLGPRGPGVRRSGGRVAPGCGGRPWGALSYIGEDLRRRRVSARRGLHSKLGPQSDVKVLKGPSNTY